MKTTEILHANKLNSNVLKCSVSDFIGKVKEVSCMLDINPNWLMLVMDLETAGTFDPSITNKLGYTGLIQFGEAAASDCGTTTARLRNMNGVQQMDFVYKYLRRYKSRIKNFQDVYLAVFFPAAIGRPEDWVLHTSRLSPARIAKWNPLFDTNRDMKITVKEIKDKLISRVPANFVNKM